MRGRCEDSISAKLNAEKKQKNTCPKFRHKSHPPTNCKTKTITTKPKHFRRTSGPRSLTKCDNLSTFKAFDMFSLVLLCGHAEGQHFALFWLNCNCACAESAEANII